MSPQMLVFVLICALAVLMLASVKRIPEGHAYTLRRIGGHMRTIGAGTHLIWPLIERVAHKIRLLGNVVEVASSPSDSHDTLRGRVYFQVIDATRADEVIDGIADLLRQRIPELTAKTCTEVDLAARNLHLKTELNRDMCRRGVLITRVQLAAS